MKKTIPFSKESDAEVRPRRCVSAQELSSLDMPEKTSAKGSGGILSWIENIAIKFLYKKDQPRRVPIPFSKL